MAAPVLPSPKTWSAGNFILAPRLRADVSDTVALLSGPPVFVGYQATTAQVLTVSGTSYGVALDTENIDSWNGHQTTGANNDLYYGQLAGWYLVEATMALNSTAAGQFWAGVGAVQSGGSYTAFQGERVNTTASASDAPAATSSKLILQTVVGAIGGSNDYIVGLAGQANMTTPALLNSTSTIGCGITARWVAGNIGGTSSLAVPVNANWPSPASDVTSAFMNTNVRDAANFLINRPIMEAYNSGTSQTVASSTIGTTGTVMSLDTKVVDNYAAFSTGTHTWTAPVSGLYYCYAQACGTVAATGRSLAAGLQVNSSNYNSGSTVALWGGINGTSDASPFINCAVARRRLRLNAGDTLASVAYYHDTSSGVLTCGLGTGSTSRLITVWEADLGWRPFTRRRQSRFSRPDTGCCRPRSTLLSRHRSGS